MRIAFDARPLLGHRTGVSVWLEGLLRGLAASTDWHFVLCLPRPEPSLSLDDLSSRVTVLSAPLRLPGTIWLHTLAAPLVAGRADAYVGTLGTLPRRLTLPAVLAVHDLTPRTRPRHHTLANRYCFNAYFEESALRATEVVCVSEATRRVLAALLPQVAARARVIGEGVDPFFAAPSGGEEGEATRTRFASGRRFLVQLGTLEPRKGIATLLAAHATLVRAGPSPPDLVLAGAVGWGGDWLERALDAHPDRARVHLPGYVSREDARALLRHAEAAVMASDEEGFGLPLAEALACGAACVASDAPALVEVAAGAARHFARGDAAMLAAVLTAALVPAEQARLRAAARRRAAAFAWAGPLAAWRELLQEVAGPPRA
ncbi:MAG: glycosyltransferase family 4 protein [Thermoanaerobaculales bacterium]